MQAPPLLAQKLLLLKFPFYLGLLTFSDQRLLPSLSKGYNFLSVDRDRTGLGWDTGLSGDWGGRAKEGKGWRVRVLSIASSNSLSFGSEGCWGCQGEEGVGWGWRCLILMVGRLVVGLDSSSDLESGAFLFKVVLESEGLGFEGGCVFGWNRRG